ncbi:CPXCG motif-containing cysteine-rich protein [Flavivirga amylovorans]|uniref:CPXCG motif-containing cysteine-rich protein n=1 Tax=Flavivirga amylovorans TaxID=870486 RepID=A0ABT8X3U5_9FLAO|nr:CPXCG motif-containing cysteine-rich protein [Flavivirga amylovorans]MDO5988512.1 CPXCG motif-containing cysteine-rich protein [Flavivirga amylovorans]
MQEHFFTCPYCWERISVLIDNSIAKQSYIEDCEVCCNPIQVSVQFLNSELVDFQASSIEQ